MPSPTIQPQPEATQFPTGPPNPGATSSPEIQQGNSAEIPTRPGYTVADAAPAPADPPAAVLPAEEATGSSLSVSSSPDTPAHAAAARLQFRNPIRERAGEIANFSDSESSDTSSD